MLPCRRFALAKSSRLSLSGLALLLLAIVGCAEPLPPEHTAAISKMQGLGAKVTFYEGGYSLNLRQSRLEDADLKSMHDIQKLVLLDIRDTRVTDNGLEEIATLPDLIRVNLGGTMTTRDGIEALKQKRPDLEVH